jgi:hypothetical protein
MVLFAKGIIGILLQIEEPIDIKISIFLVARCGYLSTFSLLNIFNDFLSSLSTFISSNKTKIQLGIKI